MMCYRDMTFCRFIECGRSGECPRALTDEVQRAAEKWWGGADAPIAVFTERPSCFVEPRVGG